MGIYKMLFATLLLVSFMTGCGSSGGGGVGIAGTTGASVSSTVPANLATGAAINASIAAAFSEAMNASTVTDTTFTLKQGATVVSGAVTYVGTTATFNPTGNLTPSTTYTAAITTGVKDLVGNALASDYEWTFTTGTTADTTAPIVSSTIPADADTDVAIGGNIAATFSEAVDASTVTTATFTLKQGGTDVPGAVTYVGATATFNPTANLAASTTYTAAFTTGVKDLAGNALAAGNTWTFTTGTTADTTAPTVSSTLPADSATGVAVNANITATFSEAMNPLTITPVTFTLKQGATVVSGAVTSPSTTTATFNPTGNLEIDTPYTATVTTGVKDLAGNALAVTKTWSFTTVAAVSAGPQPVDLGLAGDYVILAKTGISTTGTTAVDGNLGLSPAAATFITGFALTQDSTNKFSTSSIVTGKIFAADYAVPTPSNLTTAILNMETAYTDAAGRSLPDFTELGAGDISGMTLTPGLYKWGTGVMIDNTGVTLSGGADDVWIFQVAQDLTVANGAIVTLSGGAQAKNIFWQVAGETTLGTTSDFKGIILCQTLIALNTGTIMNGRALAQTAVTLDATAITAP